MPSLTLRPVTYVSGTLVNTTNVANINDSSDATFIESASGNGVDGQWIYTVTDVPSDFATMDSSQVTLTIRCAITAPLGDDTWRVRGELTNDAGSAISNVPAYVNLSSSTAVQQFTFVLTKTGANTKAAWDDVRVLLDYQNVKNMAADGNVFRVMDAWLTGTYTASAPKTEQGTAAFTASSVFTATGTVPVAGTDNYSTAVLADSPIGYWRLGETSGTTAASVTGAHNGTYSGGVILNQTGAITGNPGATFDGTDDRVVVPHHANLGGLNGYSAEAWVKPTDRLTQRQIVSKGQYNSGWRFRIETTGNLWAISPQDGGAAELRIATSTGVVPLDSAWHHVVVTYTPAAGRTDFYIDGVAAGSTTTVNTGAVKQNTEDVKIGALADVVVSNNELFKGGLDEIAFYNYPLTLSQVQSHYAMATTAPGGISAPIALGTGASAADSGNCVVTTSAAAPAGSCIVVAATQATSAPVASCTDSAGNTYTRVVNAANGNGSNTAIFVALNATLASGGTITLPAASGATTSAVASAFTGVFTVGAVDQSGGTFGTSATPTAPGLATTTADQVIVGAFGGNTVAITPTAHADWPLLGSRAGTGTFPRWTVAVSRKLSATGTYTPTTTVQASQPWEAVAVSLKGTPTTGTTQQGTASFTSTSTFTAGAITPLNSFTDSFSTLNNWTTGNGTVTASGGELVITPGTNVPDAYPYARTTGIFNATGQTLTVQMVERPTTGGGVETLFGLWDSAATLQWQDHARFLRDGGSNLVAQVRGQTPVTITDGATRPWWRISESGGTLTFSTSVDGLSWAVGATFTTPAWYGSARVWAASGSWNTSVPSGLARFDNLNLPPTLTHEGTAAFTATSTFMGSAERTGPAPSVLGSSNSGVAVEGATTISIPVPAGAATGKLAWLSVYQWNNTGVNTVTWPAGFTESTGAYAYYDGTGVGFGQNQIRSAYKRLTGTDTGNYVVTVNPLDWVQGIGYMLGDVIASGDPVDVENQAVSTTGTTVPSVSVTTADARSLLLHLAVRYNAGTQTPPTGFTEVQDLDLMGASWRLPGTSGSQTASGGTVSSSMMTFVSLAALKPAASTVTVLRTGTFETALVNTTSGYDNTGESSANAINSRDTTLAYIGTASHKARHNGYTGSASGTGIIRGNWYNPPGSTVHTDPVISRGTERWTGGAFYIRTGDTHVWTGLMRWSDYVTPEVVAKSLLEVTLESGNLTVNLTDYGGSTTGVANRFAIHTAALPRTNGWTYIELGSFVHEDNTIGWTELWVDGVQVGSRVTGRTLKLSSHNFRHIQFGMGTYGLDTNGYVNPAAEVNVDDTYLADGRRGSSLTTVTHQGLASFTASSVMTSAAARTVPALAGMSASSVLTSAATRLVPTLASMSASSVLTSAATRTVPALAGMTASSTLTSAATRLVPALAGMSASSIFTAVAEGISTQLGAATFTASSTLTAGATRLTSAAASFVATSVTTAGGMRVVPVQSAMTATSALQSGIVVARPGTAAYTATSVLTVSVDRLVPAGVSLVSTSVLTAAGLVAKFIGAGLEATSTLTIGTQVTRPAAAVLTATSVFVGEVTQQGLQLGQASLVASSTLSSAGHVTRVSMSAMTSSSVIQSAGLRVVSGFVTMSAASSLSAEAERLLQAAANLAASSAFVAGAGRSVPAVAALSASSTWLAQAVREQFVESTFTSASVLAVTAVRLTLGTATFTAISALMSDGTTEIFFQAEFSASSLFTAGTEPVRMVFVRSPITGQMVPAIVKVRNHWTQPWVEPTVKVRNPDLPSQWIEMS